MADTGEHEPAPDATRWRGHVVGGRYRIQTVLGVGGMGTALLAHDERMNRKVVLKVPDPELLKEPRFRKRFEREIRSLTSIEHPNVVKAIDVGVHEGIPYAVLQYLAGGDLRTRLDDLGRPMTPAEVVPWLVPVADALAYLHASGFVHRDVKPENVLFDDSGHPLLADFGLAKAMTGTQTGVTTTGKIAGSPYYMAPEVLSEDALTPAYDQYALGVCAYVALSGRFPVSGSTPAEVLLKRRREASVPLHVVAPAVPEGVSSAVMRALERNPRNRWASCLDFARAVAEAARAPAGAVAGPHPGEKPKAAPGKPAGRRPVRRRSLVLLASAAVAAIAVLLAILSGGGGDGPVRKPPPVTWRVELPEEGVVTASRDVRVSVLGVYESGARVFANGVEAPWDGRAFLTSVRAQGDGPFEIAIEREAWGRREKVTDRTVFVDTTAPVLKVTEPPTSPFAVEEETATVAGKAEDLRLAEVRLGETALPVGADGTFSTTVPLKAGEDTFVWLVAEDSVGNRSSAIVTIRRVAPGTKAMARAEAAASAGDWKAVAAFVAEAKAKGFSASAIPARLEDGLDAMKAVDDAVAKADAHDWQAAKDFVRKARGRRADVQVPERLVTGLAAWDDLVRAADEARKGEWAAMDASIGKAKKAGLTEADYPKALSDRLFVRGQVEAAKAAAAAGTWDAVRRAYDLALTHGGTRADFPREVIAGMESVAVPPVVAIEEPVEGIEVRAAEVRVRGTVKELRGEDVVTVNGTVVPTTNGAFDLSVALEAREGPQTIAVRVVAGAKVRAEASRRVVRLLDPSLAFLEGWAKPEGDEKDPLSRYPRTIVRTTDGARMVFVPAGTFAMGAADEDSEANADEKPMRLVTLSRAYYLDAGEVTVEQFDRFVRARTYETSLEKLKPDQRRDRQGRWMPVPRATWKDPLAKGSPSARPADPVRYVSWEDTWAYAHWAGSGASLPTEAQVERARRWSADSRVTFAGVGQFWCADGYGADAYNGRLPTKDPIGKAETTGPWAVRSMRGPRTSQRGSATAPGPEIGIRLVFPIP